MTSFVSLLLCAIDPLDDDGSPIIADLPHLPPTTVTHAGHAYNAYNQGGA